MPLPPEPFRPPLARKFAESGTALSDVRVDLRRNRQNTTMLS